MSYYTIAKSLTGKIPQTPLSLAQEAVAEAIGKIYDQADWSFQRGITYGQWLCPGNVANIGMFNVETYSTVVTANNAASAAIATYVNSPGSTFLTNLQFRNPAYSIYNIVGVAQLDTVAYALIVTGGSGQVPGVYTVAVTDAGGSGSGAVLKITVASNGVVQQPVTVVSSGANYVSPVATLSAGGVSATFNVGTTYQLTLDRQWLEPINGESNYMIYQAYFVAPVQDFRKFIEVRDTTDADRLDFWSMTQAQLAVYDPQRTEFADSSYVVPAGVDTRPGSSTAGWPMFELWPGQLSYIPYSFSYRRRGVVPQTYQDFVSMDPPYPITEDMVSWRAREVLCQYKEAQKDKTEARGSGANWLLLAQMARKEYDELFDKQLAIDVNLNGEMYTRIEGRGRPLSNAPYSNQLGQLNIGGYPTRD